MSICRMSNIECRTRGSRSFKIGIDSIIPQTIVPSFCAVPMQICLGNTDRTTSFTARIYAISRGLHISYYLASGGISCSSSTAPAVPPSPN